MIKVKICGITNLEDALLAEAAGADALGFIFTKKSPRYINEKDARGIISELGPFTLKVGVFVDEEKERVLEIATSLGLNLLQFHGQESPTYCQAFSKHFKVIKTFFPQDRPFKDAVLRYNVDAFLFDIRLEEKMQAKKTLPLDILRELSVLIKDSKRVIISGGLNPNNLKGIKRLKPYAVDVASGVEKFIGKKDEKLVSLFIREVKG